MDMVLHVELKQYLNLYNKKTLTFLQLAFSLITGHGLQIREIGIIGEIKFSKFLLMRRKSGDFEELVIHAFVLLLYTQEI